MARRSAKPALPRPADGGPARGDPGPAERYRHGDTIRTEPGEAAGVFTRRVTTQSVLDRYLARAQITPRQYDAGMKLYRLWRAAGGAQRVTASYGALRAPARAEQSDEQAALHRRVTDILRRAGPLSGVLVHVCLCDEAAREWARARGDAPQAGVVVLRLALDALAEYWGL